MLKNRKIIPPTQEEDEAINRGIAEDPDTFELSGEQFSRLKRMPPERLGNTEQTSAPEMIDEENPEWGDADFANAKTFDQMPEEFQAAVRRARGQ
ncbi:hypothetical protein ACQUFY_08410 [Robbsia andropogonis]|uniref:hypothetical protein n=1 Tax=Robbsia andropogonis TaxID=28092 RepID=UPI003D23385C